MDPLKGNEGAPEGVEDAGEELLDESSFAVDVFEQIGSEGSPDTLEEGDGLAGVETPLAQVANQGGAQEGGSPGEATSSAAPAAEAQTSTPQQGGQVDPAVAAAAAAAQGQAAPVVPAQGAQSEGAQPAQADAVAPGPDPLTLFAQEVEKNREVFTNALATTVYKLSDADVEELETNAPVAVPKILAKAHVNIVQNVLGTIAQQLPHVVGGIIQARQKHTEMEDAFFSQWKQLDRTKHRDVVLQIAKQYRAANPTVPAADMMKFVGAQAVVMLGLHQQAASAAAPAAPARQPAFRPAGGSAPLAAPSTPAQPNVWAEAFEVLGDEVDLDG